MTRVIVDVEATGIGQSLLNVRAKGLTTPIRTVVNSTIMSKKLVTDEDLAEWIIEQSGRQVFPDTDFQKRLTIDYHVEEFTSPETGELSKETVIDAVSSVQLPADNGRESFLKMSGWSTWEPDDAAEWVEDNVTSLQDAKDFIKEIARTIIHLRKITID